MEVSPRELLRCHGYVVVSIHVHLLEYFFTRSNRRMNDLILDSEVGQLVLSLVSDTINRVLLNF